MIKISVPLKKTRTETQNLDGKFDWKRQLAKRIRQRKNARIRWGQKGKTNNTTRGNKPEGRAKEGRLKRYRDRIKQHRQKQDIPKQLKKILSTSWGRMQGRHTNN